jgi:DNA replication protein DnaC
MSQIADANGSGRLLSPNDVHHVSGSPGNRQESSRASDPTCCHSAGLSYVIPRDSHLADELAETTIDGTRKEHMDMLVSVPLLIIDDLGMRKMPMTAAEDLLEIVMRRYERASTLLTSNRPVEDSGKLLGGCIHVGRRQRSSCSERQI